MRFNFQKWSLFEDCFFHEITIDIILTGIAQYLIKTCITCIMAIWQDSLLEFSSKSQHVPTLKKNPTTDFWTVIPMLHEINYLI